MFGEEVRGNSHKLIEKLMLLANMQAARALMKGGGPILLRRQEGEATNASTWLERMQEAHCAAAEYVLCDGLSSSTDTRHAALGVDAYTHFTSPIRRYADQIVHRLLFSQTTMVTDDVVEHLNLLQKQHRRYQRDRAILDYVHSRQGDVPDMHMGIILPPRLSEWGVKLDIAIPALEMVYPMRVFNPRKLGGVFDIAAGGGGDEVVKITNHQTGAAVTLYAGQEIPVTLHVRPREPVLLDKCTLTSDAFAILYE
jgi:hypothetical protein